MYSAFWVSCLVLASGLSRLCPEMLMLGEQGQGTSIWKAPCAVWGTHSLSHLTHPHLIPNMQVLRVSAEGLLSCSESRG